MFLNLKGLQNLQDSFSYRGFNVLAFPCNQFGKQEPGTNEEIKQFARVNMTATFPLFDKVKSTSNFLIGVMLSLSVDGTDERGMSIFTTNHNRWMSMDRTLLPCTRQ